VFAALARSTPSDLSLACMLAFRTSLNEVQTDTNAIRITAALIFIRARFSSFLAKVQRQLSSLIFITIATEYRLQKEAMRLAAKHSGNVTALALSLKMARENGRGNGHPARGSSSHSLRQLKMVGFEQTFADPRNNILESAQQSAATYHWLGETVAISVSFESQSHGRLCRQQTLRWRSTPELGFALSRLQTLAPAS